MPRKPWLGLGGDSSSPPPPPPPLTLTTHHSPRTTHHSPLTLTLTLTITPNPDQAGIYTYFKISKVLENDAGCVKKNEDFKSMCGKMPCCKGSPEV